MKFRVLFIAVALIALTSFAFGQSVQFMYTPPQPPLTDDDCFNAVPPGTSPIPDGAPIDVYVNDVLIGTDAMNGCGMGGNCGNFMTLYWAGALGNWYVEVTSGGCTYTSCTYPITAASPQQVFIQPSDWTCQCEPPIECVWVDFKGFLCLDFEGPGEEFGKLVCWCCPLGVDPTFYANLYYTPGCDNECNDPTCMPYNGAVYGIDYPSQSVVADDQYCPDPEFPGVGYWQTFVWIDGEGCICLYFQSQLPVELTAEPILQIGDRQVTLSFDVADELDVQHYDIMRDDAKVAELEVADGSYTYVDQNLINGRRYEYSIVAVGLDETVELDRDGNTVWTATPSFKAAVVTEYALHQNYPNPFNPSTEIVYDVLDLTHVTLKVYNVMGQEVATLMNQDMTTGRYAVTFDASGLTSGLYFYTVTMGDFTATKKMLLVQ